MIGVETTKAGSEVLPGLELGLVGWNGYLPSYLVNSRMNVMTAMATARRMRKGSRITHLLSIYGSG